MRYLIACALCLCLCTGCCIVEKLGEAIGKAIGEALVQALTQHYAADLMDMPLTYAELAVLDVHGPRPEFLPWYAGAEIARFTSQRLGLAPTSPLGLVGVLLQSLSDLRASIWDFLTWLNAVPEDET